MSATLNDFRQISTGSSSILKGTNTLNLTCAVQFSLSLTPLYKRAYKLFNISASGGVKNNEEDSLIGSIGTSVSKGGMYHFGLLCDENVLTTLFSQAFASIYPSGSIKIVYPNTLQTITSEAQLFAANKLLQINDIQKSSLQVVLAVLAAGNLPQLDLFNTLNNQRTLFSIPFGQFDFTANSFYSPQSDPTAIPSNFIVPAGFDYLVTFPFSGLTNYDGTIGPIGSSFGYYNTNAGFSLSSFLNFNMLPLSSEDFERIIPV